MASSSRRKYDVFISFRGEDTRYNILSHLHKALLQKRIETYVDERLERGDEISPALLKAIEESEVSVIIFSENYASSSWCLDELVHIMIGCKERNVVVPIFYHVTPSEVRKQSGRFGDAFAKLVERSKDKEELWTTALTMAANLSGWDAPINRSESELVEKIVENISEKLGVRSSGLDYHVKGLVGVEKRVDRVKSLLINSSSDVRIVGLWGMGGLGKTTLVDIIFSQFHSQFEGYCFLKNVREEWQKQGSIYLQNKLFSELLMEEKGLRVINNFARERLHRKRVLIILDDVDDPEYFEYLVGGRDWLCPGSRIIVTTRNKQVLTNIGVDEMYALEHLNEDEALHLFSLKAFKRNSPLASYGKMSRKVINYAQGVPLALKVLGSHLCSKSESTWRSALNRLKVAPHDQKIHGVLKISYDGLRDIDKEIFLDIACFFKRERNDVVQEMLDARKKGVFEDVVTVLIDNCLITITWHGELIEMHDMIQEMAWQIVSKDCKELPAERRERLLDANDIIHVLSDHTGPTKVKGILLNMSRLTEDVNLKPEAFNELDDLRFLKIMHNHEDKERCKLLFPQGINILPRTLRYLSWVGFPSLSLPSSFMAQNLVKLHMPSSQLEQLWNGSPDLVSLKYVTLKRSKKLVSILDLSQANLKILDLRGCTSLVEIPPLRFQRASVTDEDLHSLWGRVDDDDDEDRDDFYAIDDYTLDLSGCSNLKTLSRMSGGIRHLYLCSTAVEELNCSNWSLENLVSLALNNCKCLKSLPSNICKLDSLEILDLSGCLSFNKFPTVLPRNIQKLYLDKTSIQEVPSSVSFECLSSLLIISMKNCTRLETLPTEIFKLKSLKSLFLRGCSELKSFPEISEPHEELWRIELDGSGIKELPLSIENLHGLDYLSLRNCENLEFVPDSICNINDLRFLNLSKCPKLQTLPTVTWASFFPGITLDISYKSITKILEWLCFGSSSLPVLDPSEPIGERITVSIKRFFNLIYFAACGYADGHYAYCKEMAAVMSKFQPYFLQAATKFHSNHEEQDEETKCPGISFCHRGSKIPKWFNHQSKRSSIDLSFSRDWYNTSFLGFAVCIGVGLLDFCKFDSNKLYDLNFTCEYHFKTNRGDSTFQKSRDVHLIKHFFSGSHYMFTWYVLYKNYHDYHVAIEASFQFFVELLDSDTRVKVADPIIVNCGIRILYRQDIGEFCYNQVAEGELDIVDNIKCDTDEPHPKRTKFQDFRN